MEITIKVVKDEYAAQAESLDRLGLPIPSYMVIEEVRGNAEVTQLPSPAPGEIEALFARFQ